MDGCKPVSDLLSAAVAISLQGPHFYPVLIQVRISYTSIVLGGIFTAHVGSHGVCFAWYHTKFFFCSQADGEK